MSPRGNNMIPCGHFHKNWQRYVRTWFNQSQKKVRRNKIRKQKARMLAPQPIKGPLRPIVHCPSFRYNSKIRPGRGFSLAEIRKTGMCANYARTIGIAVDHRRRNKSVELQQKNIQRLREYRNKLILFPLKNHNKKLKINKEEHKTATQNNLKTVMRIRAFRYPKIKARIITEEEKNLKVFSILRRARTEIKTKSRRHRNRRVAKEDQENKI